MQPRNHLAYIVVALTLWGGLTLSLHKGQSYPFVASAISAGVVSAIVFGLLIWTSGMFPRDEDR